MEEFLNWLNLQVSRLPRQNLHKNQLQQLLLGIAFSLRDLEFVCFTDHEETPLPQFLMGSHMAAEDSQEIATALERLFKVVEDHIK